MKVREDWLFVFQNYTEEEAGLAFSLYLLSIKRKDSGDDLAAAHQRLFLCLC